MLGKFPSAGCPASPAAAGAMLRHNSAHGHQQQQQQQRSGAPVSTPFMTCAALLSVTDPAAYSIASCCEAGGQPSALQRPLVAAVAASRGTTALVSAANGTSSSDSLAGVAPAGGASKVVQGRDLPHIATGQASADTTAMSAAGLAAPASRMPSA